ncbi:MAG: NnrU family protein [Sinobacteraceae bacterium]|nr:NnrU family protein [Nevskiaceae bacterium]
MRALILLYGIGCYVVFFLTFLYAIGFVGDLPLPKTIDRPAIAAATGWQAWIIDLVLLGIFAVQHSGMARRGFKIWLTRWLPTAAERSTYVLLSSLALILLYWQWRPLAGTVWNAPAGWSVGVLWGLFALGWLLVLSGTFVISHFDLFGLRQVWLYARGRKYAPPEFKEGLYYRLVRHPLMLGFLIAFWATPKMSVGHLLFSVATTGYILLALQLEERDLLAAHGESYRDYQRRVPMLCPWPRPRGAVAKRART